MNNIYKLTRGELMKILKAKTALVMAIILTVVAIGMAGIFAILPDEGTDFFISTNQDSAFSSVRSQVEWRTRAGWDWVRMLDDDGNPVLDEWGGEIWHEVRREAGEWRPVLESIVTSRTAANALIAEELYRNRAFQRQGEWWGSSSWTWNGEGTQFWDFEDNQAINGHWGTQRMSGSVRANRVQEYNNNARMINHANWLLTNDINPLEIGGSSTWGYASISMGVLGVIVLVGSLLVASSIVASESSNGTIKLLLIRPHTRWKILTGKLIASSFYMLAMLILSLIMSIVAGFILFGANGAGDVIPGHFGSTFLAMPPYAFVLLNVLASIPGYLILIVFAFMLSTLFKNSGLAIAMTMLLNYIVLPIVGFIATAGARFMGFTIFANLDLTTYFSRTSAIEGQTPLLTALIMILHAAGALALSYFIFMRRDAK